MNMVCGTTCGPHHALSSEWFRGLASPWTELAGWGGLGSAGRLGQDRGPPNTRRPTVASPGRFRLGFGLVWLGSRLAGPGFRLRLRFALLP